MGKASDAVFPDVRAAIALQSGITRQVLAGNRSGGRSSLDMRPQRCQNFGLRHHLHTPARRFPMDSHPTTLPSDDVFEASDVEFFTAEDTQAGQAICKLLSVLFMYTLFAMTVTTLVTLYWINGR